MKDELKDKTNCTAVQCTKEDFDECIDLLFEVVYQECAVHPFGVQDCLDSMAMRTYADAMRYLAKHGKLMITKEAGRRVFATVEG